MGRLRTGAAADGDAPAAASGQDVEDYFDRLDAAFANLDEKGTPPSWPRPEPGPEPAPPPAPSASASSPVPPLPDAFATLLEAERSGAAPAAAAWPSSTPGDLSEQAIDGIVERVLARMSDRVIRETVTDVVSDVAERLVREEIERIKDQVK